MVVMFLFCYIPHWCGAGSYCLPIHMNQTNATYTHTATVFGAFQPQCIAQNPQQGLLGIGLQRMVLVVNCEVDHDR